MNAKKAKNIILFDCMETLIDMNPVPGNTEYARWAYAGSAAQRIWSDFEQFLADFVHVRKMLKDSEPAHKEYEIREIYRILLRLKAGIRDEAELTALADDMFNHFWRTYVNACYVTREVRSALAYLCEQKYTLAIVSNFIVQGGVEQILETLGMKNYFRTVVASISIGWRKPHSIIYNEALRRLNTTSAEALFIGDDYHNDYIRPKELGFTAYLYDTGNKYPGISDRLMSFAHLPAMIEAAR